MADLEGRTAVVTGAAMGIGLAAARALARDGARVMLLDRDRDGLCAAVDVLQAERAVVHAVACDVSTPDDVGRAAHEILERSGGAVDVLVNSAGVQRYGTVVETPVDSWDEVMNVNVRGIFLMAKHLVPALVARRGSMVNVASVQALGGRPGSVAYVASKHAVLGLTRAMALDHAPHLRVNCVAPGSVDTPMLRTAARHFSDDVEGVVADLGAMHPLGRIATAEEVAEVIAFLAGPRASFVSGACWVVDGALMAAIK